MKYAYEDLSDSQFEKLVVVLCQKLLGLSAQGFTPGPDGGRDAKFVGKAEHIPSKSEPWKGTVIIQAKHTNGHNRKFSDPDFFSLSRIKSILLEEIPRIKKLRKTNALDHYMLFSNRHLTGNAESAIRRHISGECAIPEASIQLCGIEQIELWLKHFPDVPKIIDLDPIDCPLIVSPNDLAEVVESLAKHLEAAANIVDDPPTPRVSYDKKNTINNMTPAYAKDLRKRYLKETSSIRDFLASPENLRFQRLYESIVEEFHIKIIAKRRDYQSFDDVMNYLVDLLFKRDQTLSRQKRLTRAMLFYMYWNCDIGEVELAEAD